MKYKLRLITRCWIYALLTEEPSSPCFLLFTTERLNGYDPEGFLRKDYEYKGSFPKPHEKRFLYVQEILQDYKENYEEYKTAIKKLLVKEML